MSNSLAAVHPELIVEWSDRNLPLTPDSVTFGSNKKVWWKGACGHEWETSVKARSNGEKCPICSGARVIEGINDLSTLKPKLASEWSEKNEIKPTEVSIGSHKKVIWKCKLGHEWTATVKSRTINEQLIRRINTMLKKTFGLWIYKKEKEENIRCLCPKCLSEYIDNPNYIVRRLDPFAKEKDRCDKCDKAGWDYVVTERSSVRKGKSGSYEK